MKECKDKDPVRADRVSRWIIFGRNKRTATGCAGRDIGSHSAPGYALRSVCPHVECANFKFFDILPNIFWENILTNFKN